VARIEPDKREEWDAMLTAPLPGRETRRSEVADEDEGRAFLGLMAQVGARQGISGGSPG